ncbi:MAG: glycoside hydrolase family 99-like domain-containing protein [Chloroflexi bacterium]|jgi:hypothetical protein|nr:glycoside hydrolase family 99-like domain-containing protein [Chloroflexota bacterium]
MRSLVALLATLALACCLAPPRVAAAPAAAASANGFSGDFALLEQGSGTVVARVVARFAEPTVKRLVPGTLDIYWTSAVTTDPYWGTGAPFVAHESHGQILRAAFWGAGTAHRLSSVQGWICDHTWPQAASCHGFQMAFGTNSDGTPRKVSAFGEYGWCCDGRWYDVGAGTFSLTVATDTRGFPWGRRPAPEDRGPGPLIGPSGVLSAQARQTSAGDGFVGAFDLLASDSTHRRVGRVTARLAGPDSAHLAAGSIDITWTGSPRSTGSTWPPAKAKESHGRVLRAAYSHDPDGSVRARVEGVMCDYLGPQSGSCHGFTAELVAAADPKKADEVRFGTANACCKGPRYVAGKGTFRLTDAASAAPTGERHVGASYMTFWGIEPEGTPGLWSHPRSDTPRLGTYDSADPEIGERHIATAREHGIDLFLLDFGWITPGSDIDRAARDGLLRASNVDRIDLALLYFPDPVVSPTWGEGPARFRSDFAYMAAAYFSHPSYLRIDGRPVLVFNGLTAYWEALGVAQTNALFAEVKKKYDLYLVAGLHPDADPANLVGSPFDALMLWGNMWGSLGDDPDLTYTYAQYSTAYRGYWTRWHDLAVASGRQFVPSIYPGFDNALAVAAFGQAHTVIGRDLAEFTSLTRFARQMATDPLAMTLVFSWNDFSEGHAIEPSTGTGETYVDAVAAAFAE